MTSFRDRDTQGVINYSVPADLPGVGAVVHLQGNHATSCYLNTHFTLKLIHQSASTLHFRGKSCTAPGRPGSLVSLLDPGEMLRTTHVRMPETIDGVMIMPEFMAQTADELGLKSQSLWFRNTFLADMALADTLRDFFTALAQPQTALERQSRLLQVMYITLQTCMEVRPRPIGIGKVPAAIRNAKAFLHENFAGEISLDELIAETGLSRCHLMRSFTKAVGVPPHRYQIHLRIARARELLSRGLPPSWVATSVGFYDQSHFGRQFRRIVGVTPSRYGNR